MGMNRRSFMMFMAGATAGVLATPVPWKLLDDVSIWTQNWGWIPRLQDGVNSFVPAVSKTCPSAVAMRIRLVDGRPVRVLPDHAHPLGGGITALAAAELQMMHSPARVQAPLRRTADGAYVRISWAEAGELLAAEVKKAGANINIICGDESGSTLEVLAAFAEAQGSNNVFLMPSEGQVAAAAAEAMGIEGQLGFDIDQSDYVLAIGADIFETWGTVVRNRKAFASAQPYAGMAEQPKARFAYAGALQNSTAAVAEPWLALRPGSEVVFALCLAAELIKRGRRVDSPDFAAFRQLALQVAEGKGAEQCGLSPERIAAQADALVQAKAPLVIVGQEGAGATPAVLSYLINALLGSINRPGGMTLLPDAPVVLAKGKTRRQLYRNSLFAWLADSNKKGVLLVHEANPAYALPDPASVAAAIKKMSFAVSFSSFLDETAMLCDLVLPLPMGLERMDDIYTPFGSGQGLYCITAPLAQGNNGCRMTADVLLFVAKQLGQDLGYASYADVVRAKATRFGEKAETLAKGKVCLIEDRVHPYGTDVLIPLTIMKEAVQRAQATDIGLALVMDGKLKLGTATTGIPPFNTKAIRADELQGSAMSVMINGKTAQKIGLVDAGMVTIDVGEKRLVARLRIFEGIADDAIAVCKGYGHTALDAFSQSKGANVMSLVSARLEPLTGLGVWTGTRVHVTSHV